MATPDRPISPITSLLVRHYFTTAGGVSAISRTQFLLSGRCVCVGGLVQRCPRLRCQTVRPDCTIFSWNSGRPADHNALGWCASDSAPGPRAARPRREGSHAEPGEIEICCPTPAPTRHERGSPGSKGDLRSGCRGGWVRVFDGPVGSRQADKRRQGPTPRVPPGLSKQSSGAHPRTSFTARASEGTA